MNVNVKLKQVISYQMMAYLDNMATYDHILLAVSTRMCPGHIEGPPTQLTSSLSMYSKLALSSTSENSKKPIEMYYESIKVGFSNQ